MTTDERIIHIEQMLETILSFTGLDAPPEEIKATQDKITATLAEIERIQEKTKAAWERDTIQSCETRENLTKFDDIMTGRFAPNVPTPEPDWYAAERERAESWRRDMESKIARDNQILTLRLEIALARLGTSLPELPAENVPDATRIPGAKAG